MKRQMPSTKEIEREILDRIKNMFRKDFEYATKEEIYRACSEVVNEVVIDNWLTTQREFAKQDPKCVYYMSMEFLIGRLLGNNMINMRGYTEVPPHMRGGYIVRPEEDDWSYNERYNW